MIGREKERGRQGEKDNKKREREIWEEIGEKRKVRIERK